MEYKKNRQRVILNSMQEMKGPKWETFKLPVILLDSQAAQSIEASRKNIEQQSKRLLKKIESVLRNPSSNDDVYMTLQRLFKNPSDLNLKRPDKTRFEVRNLARKRFILGYPPKKKDSDISIGDAINWEWIIKCAKNKNQDVVIVSRDTDYGCLFGNEPIINDWLLQEFKERVNRRKKVILTDKLMQGFKLAGISVQKTEEQAEERLLSGIKEQQRKSGITWKDIMKEFEKELLNGVSGNNEA